MRKYEEKNSFLYFVALFLSFVFLFSLINPILATDDPEEIKDDIEDIQKKLDREEAEKLKLEQDLGQIQGSVNSTVAAIRKTESLIDEKEETIERKEKEIVAIEERIILQKELVRSLIQEYYYSKKRPLLEVALNQAEFSKVLVQEDSLSELELKIVDLTEDLRSAKEKIGNEKNALEGEKKEHEELLAVKEKQKNALLSEKYETQGDIQTKEKKIRSLSNQLSELKSALSGFLGESFDASDIVEAIKFASKKTGVRKEFLMAMLDKETDLGRFTGGCTYKNTKVKEADKIEFKKICKELGYDYEEQKISCAASWGGYGGAMGVAQFMPTTWIGYKSAITGYTGHKPPDPWNLTDGVVGMAEKLKRAGGNKKSGEHYAAKVYYCGGPSSAYWKTKCEAYADTVISWSDGYDEFF